jgi:hypothetical protein
MGSAALDCRPLAVHRLCGSLTTVSPVKILPLSRCRTVGDIFGYLRIDSITLSIKITCHIEGLFFCRISNLPRPLLLRPLSIYIAGG